jgi:hypothetical protein
MRPHGAILVFISKHRRSSLLPFARLCVALWMGLWVGLWVAVVLTIVTIAGRVQD